VPKITFIVIWIGRNVMGLKVKGIIPVKYYYFILKYTLDQGEVPKTGEGLFFVVPSYLPS